MPRGGGPTHLARGAARRALRDALRAPRPPKLDDDARDVRLGGRLVRVPTARPFRRRIGGRLYTSPAGSPHVYVDGRPWTPSSEHEGPPGELELPRAPLGALAEPYARLRDDPAREAAARVSGALNARRADHPPVRPGDEGAAAHEALLAAGFLTTASRVGPDDLERSYVSPDRSSLLDVEYDRADGRASRVIWRPRDAPDPGRELGRPPRTGTSSPTTCAPTPGAPRARPAAGR